MSVATRCSAVCYFNVKNSGASLYFGRPSQGRLVYGLASTPGGRGGPNFSIFICEISAGERGGWVVARTGFGINSGGSVGGKGEVGEKSSAEVFLEKFGKGWLGSRGEKMFWSETTDEEEEALLCSPALMARRASESWIVAPPVEV